MNHLKLPVALVLLLMIGCNENPEPVNIAPIKILTLNIDATLPTDKTDNWILIHDVNGKLIDYKKYEAGDKLTFEASLDKIPEGKFSFTQFVYTSYVTSINHSLESYLSNEVGQEWTLIAASNPYIPKEKIGSFSVDISEAYSPPVQYLTDRYGDASSNSPWSGGTNICSISKDVYAAEQDYFLYVMNDDGTPTYKYFQNINAGDAYSLSPNDFDTFDNTVTVTFPETKKLSFFVSGFEEGQALNTGGYRVNCDETFPYSTNRSSIKLGFVDFLPKYRTSISVVYNNIGYSYSKLGNRPTAISFPLSASFTLQDSTLDNFTCLHSIPFNYRTSTWGFTDFNSSPRFNIYWVVSAPNENQKGFEFPTEFSTLYPSLDKSKLYHLSSNFIITGDPTYNKVIETTFKGVPESETSESYSISLY